MIASFLNMLRRLSRRLVVRVLLIAALAVVALAFAVLFGQYIPQGWVAFLGDESLDAILTTLASTMLTVTTFSLSVMTAAFHNAAGLATPRARLVWREDHVTHSVLASFVGAFLFSLVAIVLRATPLVGPRESLVLFAFAIVVVAQVVYSILRWINHLETLGSMDATVSELERFALTSANTYAQNPCFGGHPMDQAPDLSGCAPIEVRATRAGYVQFIYLDILQAWAEESEEGAVLVEVQPGDYVFEGQCLLRAVHVEDRASLADEAVVIAGTRSFDQDYRLGVTVLTEIASRALSPGINDPRTAVDVVNRLGSVLHKCCPAEDVRAETQYDRLYFHPVALAELHRLSFDVIVRDGKGLAEVTGTIKRVLDTLEDLSGQAGQEAARDTRDRLLERLDAA